MKEKLLLFFFSKHCEQNLALLARVHIRCINLETKETGIGKLLLTRRGLNEDVWGFADWGLTSSQLLDCGIGIDSVRTTVSAGYWCRMLTTANVVTEVCKVWKHCQDGGMIAEGETKSTEELPERPSSGKLERRIVSSDVSTIIQMISSSQTVLLYIYSQINFDPVSKWSKCGLLSKGDQWAWVLVLQINRGTLNNRVINSPLPRSTCQIFWHDKLIRLLVLWSPPALFHCSPSSFYLFIFFTAATRQPPSSLIHSITFSFYCFIFSVGGVRA